MFSIWDEPEPDLSVSGRRLDAQAARLNVSRATNAFGGDIKTAMLVGVDFPTTGCWGITGVYKGAELSFVIWIAPCASLAQGLDPEMTGSPLITPP